VLRGIFGPKREEVAGGGRKLHNEELHNFYSSSNIFRVISSVSRGLSQMCVCWRKIVKFLSSNSSGCSLVDVKSVSPITNYILAKLSNLWCSG
jgi:hypothetical protein